MLSDTEFIVVRHSERLDEVAPQQWRNSLLNNNSFRDKYSLQNDTPITANGVNMASDAAKTVKELILSKYPNGTDIKTLNIRLYSSKLTRCVMTAHQLAEELGVPIYASRGLAMTAMAVTRRPFTFLNMDELASLCDNKVELHCCDDPTSPYHIPDTDWLSAIATVASRKEDINIIVAHRETIRNLSVQYLKLPYCAIGMFDATGIGAAAGEDGAAPPSAISTPPSKRPRQEQIQRAIHPLRILDKDGRTIEDWTIPDDLNTVATQRPRATALPVQAQAQVPPASASGATAAAAEDGGDDADDDEYGTITSF
jgi:broad specificity phosphatase PhoE